MHNEHNEHEYDVDYEEDNGLTFDLEKKRLKPSPLLWKCMSPFSSLTRYCVSKKTKEEKWLAYYLNLYANNAPDEEYFHHLLSHYGVWDFPTPFKDGSLMSFKFHEDNVFLADIDYVLTRWADRTLHKKNSTLHDQKSLKQDVVEQSIVEQDIFEQEWRGVVDDFKNIAVKWVDLYAHRPHMQNRYKTLSETERDNQREENEKRDAWEITAKKCLTTLFLRPSNEWGWIKKYLHKDNLKLLVHIITSEADPKTSDVLISHFIQSAWISEQDKRWLELSRHNKH